MIKNLRYIVLDVDGTLTDGGIYYSSDGKESKRFCVQDGAGIFMAEKAGIEFIILTGRESGCVTKRAEELKIKYIFQGVHNKREFLEKFMYENCIAEDEIGYIGDDLNDFEAMQLAGFRACPANATKEIKAICNYCADATGGCGAVREIIEHILEEYG